MMQDYFNDMEMSQIEEFRNSMVDYGEYRSNEQSV